MIVFPTFLGSSPTIHNCHFPFGIPVHFWWYLKNPGLITILNFSYPTLTKSVEFTPLLLLCIIFNRRSSPKNRPQRTMGIPFFFHSKGYWTQTESSTVLLIKFQHKICIRKVLKRTAATASTTNCWWGNLDGRASQKGIQSTQCAVEFNNLNKNFREVSHFSNVKW